MCATDRVFTSIADGPACDAPPAFLPVRPITQADLATLTEQVRRRVIRWFKPTRLLDTAAAADMLVWENSGCADPRRVVRAGLLDRVIRVAAASGHVPTACISAGRDLAPLADVADGQCRDRPPERVVRGKDAVIPMLVLPWRWRPWPSWP